MPPDPNKAAKLLRDGGSSRPGQSAAEKSDRPDDAAPWRKAKADGSPGEGDSAFALATADFPPPSFAIAGLLPEGLTILAGRPKQGKSWLSLLIGWAVAGGHVLDGRETTPGAVIYLALEDTRPRLKSRINSLAGGTHWNPPRALTLHTRWPRATEQERGIYYLADWLQAKEGEASRLVIIDTLAKFRKPQTGSGNSYHDDYEAVSELKMLLDHYRATGLLIHHTRKLRAEDPFDEMSGTLGISGAADSLWVLDRERGSESAKLFLTGRDMADQTIPLVLDKASCRWTLGTSQDGIDRPAEGEKTGSKVEQCKSWLRDFLKAYAGSSKEIEVAAKAAGFAFSALRDAKAALGKYGSGELTNHKFGAGEWWSGLGPVSGWKYRPGRAPAGSETSEGSETSRDHWNDR